MDSKFFILLGVICTLGFLAIAIFRNPVYFVFATTAAWFTRAAVKEHQEENKDL